MPEFQSGAVIDTRPPEEKQNDTKFKELVATIDPVKWVEKTPSQWRKFPIFNQNGSGSCVAQTIAKMLGVMYWLKNQVYVHFSATHIYQRRVNKPTPGMIAVDAFSIAQKSVTLEQLVPSQEMTDQQMDIAVIEGYKNDVGAIFKSGKPVDMPIGDIESVASTIQKTGKAVMVWFYFGMNEWNQVVPQIVDPNLSLGNAAGLHSVPAVDFTLYQGKKALIIEDSWGANAGLNGQRVITEDFFKVRNWFTSYLMNFKFEEQGIEKPQYTFSVPLEFGIEGQLAVKMLQDILKYEGLFPANVASTGNYYSETAKAVLAWQKKHNVAPDSELDPLQGKHFGPKSIVVANKIYS